MLRIEISNKGGVGGGWVGVEIPIKLQSFRQKCNSRGDTIIHYLPATSERTLIDTGSTVLDPVLLLKSTVTLSGLNILKLCVY
jgi:hypothetical protein